jgi:hypothetical protein
MVIDTYAKISQPFLREQTLSALKICCSIGRRS